MERWVSEIKLRAGVRIGEISRELETAPHGPGRGKSLPTDGKPFKAATLKAAGLSTSVANRCEQLAQNAGKVESYIAEREARIERAQRNAYYEIGLELAAIRDKKLYRAEFPTFEEYVEARWEMPRQHAYRLTAAAEFVQAKLSPIGVIPQRESHIRPLLEKLDNDKDREPWNFVTRYENHYRCRHSRRHGLSGPRPGARTQGLCAPAQGL